MRAMSSPDHRWLPSTRMSVASATIADARRSRVSSARPGGGEVGERVLAHDLEHPVPGARRRWLGDDERPVDQRAHQLHGPEVVVHDGSGDGVHEPEVEGAREHPEPAEDLVLVVVEQADRQRDRTSRCSAARRSGPLRAGGGCRCAGSRARAARSATACGPARRPARWPGAGRRPRRQSSATACTVRSDRSHRASLRVTSSRKRATAGAAAGSGSAGVGRPSGSSTTTRSPATPRGWRLVVSTVPSSVASQNRTARSTAPASTWSQPSRTTRIRSPVVASASASGEPIPASPAIAVGARTGREVVEAHRDDPVARRRQVGAQLLDQARLADARRARDRDEPVLLHQLLDESELLRPPDQGRQGRHRPSLPPGASRREGDPFASGA